MPYQPGNPQPGDQLNNSQADLLGNFQSLDTEMSLEHNAFSAGVAPAKHKFVTLQQRPALPARVGNDGQFSQQVTAVPNMAPYIQYADTTGTQSVCFTRTFYNVHVAQGANSLVFDFNLVMPPSFGYLLISDVGQPARTLFSPFIYSGGVLNIPLGTSPAHFGQLPSGTEFLNFIGAGTQVQLNNPNAPHIVTFQIMYSPL